MLKFGMGELIVILMIFLLLFGAKRLPEIARAIGRSLLELLSATKDIKKELQAAKNCVDDVKNAVKETVTLNEQI